MFHLRYLHHRFRIDLIQVIGINFCKTQLISIYIKPHGCSAGAHWFTPHYAPA